MLCMSGEGGQPTVSLIFRVQTEESPSSLRKVDLRKWIGRESWLPGSFQAWRKFVKMEQKRHSLWGYDDWFDHEVPKGSGETAIPTGASPNEPG